MIRVALASVVGFVAACGDKTAAPARPSTTVGRDAGLVAFATVRVVLQHPRCQNCHPAGDAPLQGDDGHVHGQFVRRGPTGFGEVGAECSTCHGPANPPSNYGPNLPPGVAPAWHMPPPEMPLVFVGLTPRALCEQIKDPARNGGKDPAALRAHLDDPLVTWGWDPGFGRAPVSTPRATFIAAWQAWAVAGAPCPES